MTHEIQAKYITFSCVLNVRDCFTIFNNISVCSHPIPLDVANFCSANIVVLKPSFIACGRTSQMMHGQLAKKGRLRKQDGDQLKSHQTWAFNL